MTARDLQAERDRWQRFLDPVTPDDHGRWSLGDGPALRLIEGTDDAIHSVVWEVSSLGQAARWLQAKGWLEDKVDDGIKIAVEPLQGLDVRLAEPQS